MEFQLNPEPPGCHLHQLRADRKRPALIITINIIIVMIIVVVAVVIILLLMLSLLLLLVFLLLHRRSESFELLTYISWTTC